MLEQIVVILCETSHPGNIGSAARAMKNMGLTRLTLVAPHRFPHGEAIALAAGASDILEKASLVTTLEEAITDFQWIFGTSARTRTFRWPQLTPKVAAQKMATYASSQQKVALVFGNEQAGLSNDQLQQCDYHVSIPTHPDYSSLNLAAAVQVIAYEIYQTVFEATNNSSSFQADRGGEKANNQEIAGLLAHFEQIALNLGFLNPNNPKKLLPRIKRLIAKAQLEKDEINIVRGFLKNVPLKKKD